MPREIPPGWPAPSPAGAVDFYTSAERGRPAPVLVVSLQRPRRPAPNCAWFVRYDEPPGRPEEGAGDPLDALALRVVEDDAVARRFRAFVATRGVRAVLFAPGRGVRALRRLLMCPDAPPTAWVVARCAHGAQRLPVLVREHTSFDALDWAVFGHVAPFASILRGGIDDIPGLMCTHVDARACPPAPFAVHFAPMTVHPAVLAARARMFGADILTVVQGQGGTWLPEPGKRFVPARGADARPTHEFVGAGAWQAALDALARKTLVVGPLYLLAAASRYVASLRAPAAAEARLAACLYGAARVAPWDAAFPPAEYLPPRTMVLWNEIAE